MGAAERTSVISKSLGLLGNEQQEKTNEEPDIRSWNFGGSHDYSPRSWLADEVVRLNCCSRYFPRKAAKPATTAISMQAARMIQVKTGLESKCFVTLGITRREKKGKSVFA